MAPVDSGTGTGFFYLPGGDGMAHFLGFCSPVTLTGFITLKGDDSPGAARVGSSQSCKVVKISKVSIRERLGLRYCAWQIARSD